MAESVLNQPEQKIAAGGDVREQSARLKRIIGIILSAVLFGLTLFVLNLSHRNAQTYELATGLVLTAADQGASNYRSYVAQYKETKIQLEETTRKLEEVNRQLDAVTAELTTTKGMLTQTQDMLAQAQAENARLKDEIMGIDPSQRAENAPTVVEDLKQKIADLKEKNVEVSGQLAQLKEQLRAFEADFGNLDEGRTLISLFQNKIKLVKSRMNYLKQEAHFAKIAAQKEKDRIAALNGNNGYVIKNGQTQKAGNKAFNIDVKIVQ